MGSSSLDLSFVAFPPAARPTDRRYFQYRVLLEAEDNTACSGSPCLPELTRFSIGPVGRYYGGRPAIRNKVGIGYSAIAGLDFTTDGCQPKYQLSRDGDHFYYWNGTAWVSAANSFFQANFSGEISARAASFVSSVGSGNFFFRAFLPSDTSTPCELKAVHLLHR